MEELVRLAGIGTGVLLGMATVLLRIGLRHDTPYRAAWFITGVGTAFLLPFSLNALPEFVEGFSWSYGILAFLGSGVMGQALGRLALYTCIDTLGPTTAATYKTLAPAFTALGAWFFFRERLSVADAFGIAAVIGGVLTMVSFQGEHSPRNTELGKTRPSPRILHGGLGLGLATALLYSGGDLLRKLGVVFLPSALIGTWLGYLSSFVVLTAYLFKKRGRQGFRTWNNRALLAFSAGAVAIMVAYVLFLVGTISAGVAITAALASIEPLAAYAIGVVLYRQGEPLKVAQVPGVVFVVIGVAIILLI